MSAMSALGQKRTLTTNRAMSALPPKADMVRHSSDVRFVPKADIAASFDHLVVASSREMEMNANPKRKPRQGNRDRAERARRHHQEEALDDALKNTFPASDPVSIEPAPPAGIATEEDVGS
jgi:hypothetical protein